MKDLIIIGAGAAGLTASVYASRYKIDHFVFGPVVGGQITEAHVIENYPGFISISGLELAERFKAHALSYGVGLASDEVAHIEKVEGGFEIAAKTGRRERAKSLILAMGAKHRRLGVKGEEDFIGRGVSYCATCDAPLFKGKTVAVVGGGDSAVSAAVHLAQFAKQVYLLVRGENISAEPVWADDFKKKANGEAIFRTQVTEVKGDSLVRGIALDNPYQGSTDLPVDGLFVEVGLIPAVGLTKAVGVELDGKGYIKVTGEAQTNVPGVFAAGDLAAFPGMMNFRQIVTSAAEGAIAAAGVYQFLRSEAPAPDWG